MKLKNVLIVVSDIERSIRFYRDIFGLQVLLDQDGNVINLWRKPIGLPMG